MSDSLAGMRYIYIILIIYVKTHVSHPHLRMRLGRLEMSVIISSLRCVQVSIGTAKKRPQFRCLLFYLKRQKRLFSRPSLAQVIKINWRLMKRLCVAKCISICKTSGIYPEAVWPNFVAEIFVEKCLLVPINSTLRNTLS